MRAISLVNRIEFEFQGNVLRNALTLGDVDNDGHNELIVGNINGEISIFKETRKIQTISNLTMIGCLSVGDVMNEKRNILVVITADGWCHLYSYEKNNSQETKENNEKTEITAQKSTNKTSSDKEVGTESGSLICIHTQRIPANSKDILIGDIDCDGMMEMVLGLTDRVVRSYRWVNNYNKDSDNSTGLFVALNKWECANQIGSITLHHYDDDKVALFIAQPGGTFMRIRCQPESELSLDDSESTAGCSDSSFGENVTGSIDYQFLGISRMRNPNISTEILGDLKCAEDMQGSEKSEESFKKRRPYAVATLDGTIMLVENEVILWAFAVDHQTFALTKLDVTGNGSDDIVVCSWDGQTYILDQDKNSVRFHLDEEVQAFTSGYYTTKFNESNNTCLIYVTFKNKVYIYYDIPLKAMVCKKFQPDPELFKNFFIAKGKTAEEADNLTSNLDQKQKNEIINFLLYNVKL